MAELANAPTRALPPARYLRDPLSPDLIAVLRRLKLGPILDTLPDHPTLARQQKTPPQDFLLLVLRDEVTRRDSVATDAQYTGLGDGRGCERVNRVRPSFVLSAPKSGAHRDQDFE